MHNWTPVVRLLAAVIVLWSSNAQGGTIVTGLGAGSVPEVGIFDAATTARITSFLAYDASFTGGVRVATGDVTGDGVADIVVGAGPGGGPHVRVFDGVSGAPLHSFFAFDLSFSGGVFVAAGDVNGDGRADIIVSPDAGGGPLVKVFDGTSLQLLQSFFAYDVTFSGGVRVAAGDVNGDGIADIVTGAGGGVAGHVKVFDALTYVPIRSFFAFDPSFTGGVFVAAGDVNGDRFIDIIVGAGPGAGPHVRVFSGDAGVELASFLAYDAGFSGGVTVAAGDVNGDGLDDIITAPGKGGTPHIKVFGAGTGTLAQSFLAAASTFTGGVYVAVGPTQRTPPTPTQRLATLMREVEGVMPHAMHLLHQALTLMEADNEDAACGMIHAFALRVIAQSDKHHLTAEQANYLMLSADSIRAELGCR